MSYAGGNGSGTSRCQGLNGAAEEEESGQDSSGLDRGVVWYVGQQAVDHEPLGGCVDDWSSQDQDVLADIEVHVVDALCRQCTAYKASGPDEGALQHGHTEALPVIPPKGLVSVNQSED